MSGLVIVARTHPGKVRDNNEDSFLAASERGRLAVIDGIGGHAAGEVAAELARVALAEGPAELRASVELANARIREHVQQNPRTHGMGCVLTAVDVTESRLKVAHVGDTRLYLADERQARQLTQDHTVQALQKKILNLTDEEAALLPGGNQVTRDVGGMNSDGVEWVDEDEQPFGFGELLLLCSDGLYDVVPGKEVEGLLVKAVRDRAELGAFADQLVHTALERGGPDNVTVLLARRTEGPSTVDDRAPRLGGVLAVGVAVARAGRGRSRAGLLDRLRWLVEDQPVVLGIALGLLSGLLIGGVLGRQTVDRLAVLGGLTPQQYLATQCAQQGVCPVCPEYAPCPPSAACPECPAVEGAAGAARGELEPAAAQPVRTAPRPTGRPVGGGQGGRAGPRDASSGGTVGAPSAGTVDTQAASQPAAPVEDEASPDATPQEEPAEAQEAGTGSPQERPAGGAGPGQETGGSAAQEPEPGPTPKEAPPADPGEAKEQSQKAEKTAKVLRGSREDSTENGQ